MLNLDETLHSSKVYSQHFDIYIKPICYSIGSIIIICIIRGQIPETDLLQLIPGFYLILVFISFISLLVLSELLFRVPQEFDNEKSFGAKTRLKLQAPLLIKLSYCLIFIAVFFSTNILVPLSLDCFNIYSENALENIWSFDEVINIESILLALLVCLSQAPSLSTLFFSNEIALKSLPNFWKIIVIFVAIFTGVITPTIDGATQLNLSLFSIILYLHIIHIIEKRVNVKFIGLNSLMS